MKITLIVKKIPNIEYFVLKQSYKVTEL